MPLLEWTEVPEGVRSGRYLIEKLGPHNFVLVIEDEEGGRRRAVVPAHIDATAPRLSALKRSAEHLERERLRRRRIFVI